MPPEHQVTKGRIDIDPSNSVIVETSPEIPGKTPLTFQAQHLEVTDRRDPRVAIVIWSNTTKDTTWRPMEIVLPAGTSQVVAHVVKPGQTRPDPPTSSKAITEPTPKEKP